MSPSEATPSTPPPPPAMGIVELFRQPVTLGVVLALVLSISGAVLTLWERLSDVNSRVASMQADIGGLQREVSTLRTEVTQLRTQMIEEFKAIRKEAAVESQAVRKELADVSANVAAIRTLLESRK